MDQYEDDRTIFGILWDAVAETYHKITARSSRRAYLSTALFLLFSLLLALLSVLAYALFYYNYIPTLGFTLPIHLQYPDLFPATATTTAANDNGGSRIIQTSHDHAALHPFGIASLPTASLTTNQPYTIRVRACLPSSPENLGAGNFMLDVELRSQPLSRPASDVLSDKQDGSVTVETILAKEARPAILTYASPMVRRAATIAKLPFYVGGLAREAECVDVPVMEDVVFIGGWRNIPGSVRVELRGRPRGDAAAGQDQETLSVYGVDISFAARFTGLRRLMFEWRIFSFLLFTGVFWAVEMAAMGLVWLLLAKVIFVKGGPPVRGIKRKAVAGGAAKMESDDFEPISDGLSDASRLFPSFAGQPPLRYSSVKDEEDEGPPSVLLHPQKERDEEADDEEDEDADYVLEEPGLPSRVVGMGPGRDDSGLGTSMESSGGASGSGANVAMRRRSRKEDSD